MGVLDTDVEEANLWMTNIAAELGTNDRQHAYNALSAVFHALRETLPVEENAQFAGQLPVLLRGVYFDGWRPGAEKAGVDSVEEFYRKVAFNYHEGGDYTPFEITRAVLYEITYQLSESEIASIKHLLPAAVRAIFPAAWQPSEC